METISIRKRLNDKISIFEKKTFNRLDEKKMFKDKKRDKSSVVSNYLVSILFYIVLSFFLYAACGEAKDQQRFVQDGKENIQAGRDVIVTHNTVLTGTDGKLEISDVRFTQLFEFDLLLRNIGDTAVIIKEVKATITKKLPLTGKPILNPSANYTLLVKNGKIGDVFSVKISHFLDAKSADRFKLHIDSDSIYEFEMSLLYNKKDSISFAKGMWQ